jgi:hypothetical protein
MSRVYMGTEGWGVIWDEQGNVQPGQSVTVKNRDGSNATHYSARTGGSSSTGSITTDSRGTLARWIDPGEYILSVGGTDYDVEAASGGVRAFAVPTVAGGGTLATPTREIIKVSGVATITSITAGEAGQQVTVIFTGTAASVGLTDGSNLKIAGNLVYKPNDTITLVCDGTDWFETARSLNTP